MRWMRINWEVLFACIFNPATLFLAVGIACSGCSQDPPPVAKVTTQEVDQVFVNTPYDFTVMWKDEKTKTVKFWRLSTEKVFYDVPADKKSYYIDDYDPARHYHRDMHKYELHIHDIKDLNPGEYEYRVGKNGRDTQKVHRVE